MGKDPDACDSMSRHTIASGSWSFVAMVGGVNPAARCRTLESIVSSSAVREEKIRS